MLKTKKIKRLSKRRDIEIVPQNASQIQDHLRKHGDVTGKWYILDRSYIMGFDYTVVKILCQHRDGPFYQFFFAASKSHKKAMGGGVCSEHDVVNFNEHASGDNSVRGAINSARENETVLKNGIGPFDTEAQAVEASGYIQQIRRDRLIKEWAIEIPTAQIIHEGDEVKRSTRKPLIMLTDNGRAWINGLLVNMSAAKQIVGVLGASRITSAKAREFLDTGIERAEIDQKEMADKAKNMLVEIEERQKTLKGAAMPELLRSVYAHYEKVVPMNNGQALRGLTKPITLNGTEFGRKYVHIEVGREIQVWNAEGGTAPEEQVHPNVFLGSNELCTGNTNVYKLKNDGKILEALLLAGIMLHDERTGSMANSDAYGHYGGEAPERVQEDQHGNCLRCDNCGIDLACEGCDCE